jgi:hypothetical protein
METPQETSMPALDIDDFKAAKFSKGETVSAGVASVVGIAGTVFALAYITFIVLMWWGFQDYEF